LFPQWTKFSLKKRKIKTIFDNMAGFFFLFVCILGALSIIRTSFRVGISPMPTSRRVRMDLTDLLPVSFEGKIFELGSGFGHLAILLSKKFSTREVFAFELSYVPYTFSLLWKKALHRNNLVIQRKDFFEVSLKEAGLVTCYLFPKAMERLKEKLLQELPKGSYVLSHTFAIRGWTPLRTIESADLGRTKIYLYRI
jgi:hypothetical protein